MIWFAPYSSPIGQLLLVSGDQGLRTLEFDYHGARLEAARRRAGWTESPQRLAACAGQLDEYFAGQRRVFDVPLDLRGTEFQRRCWSALLEIPYGETRSYADLARRVGSPRGFRAVGMANHDNPVAIIVPCHRVITSDGKLGGYGGGLSVKERLLRLEGAWI